MCSTARILTWMCRIKKHPSSSLLCIQQKSMEIRGQTVRLGFTLVPNLKGPLASGVCNTLKRLYSRPRGTYVAQTCKASPFWKPESMWEPNNNSASQQTLFLKRAISGSYQMSLLLWLTAVETLANSWRKK